MTPLYFVHSKFCIEYGHRSILTFEQKHDFWKRPFNLSTQNLLCIEYGHLDLSRHDLGKALLFCLSKIYFRLYVHPDFRTNFNMSTCTCT